MSRQELVEAVYRVLTASPEPLDAKGIVLKLRVAPFRLDVTKSDVNSVLYGELRSAGKAEVDASFRWKVVSPRAPASASSAAVRQQPALARTGEDGSSSSSLLAPKKPVSTGDGIADRAALTLAGSVLGPDDLASVSAAVREEIAAAQETVKTAWLDIDGIEHLADAPGNFVYRLILSSPVHFGPDQTVTFHTRSPKDTIQAVIVRSDDEGLVVECQKPLPTDAKLLSLSFDPPFILRALENFVLEMAPRGGRIAGLVVGKTIPEPGSTRPRSYPGLNDEQALAVEEMAATPLHLLWGPPGTGKTTTLGTAIARWLRQNKRVLVVSTSNAAVDVALRAVLKNLRPDEKRAVLRVGTSLDPVVREVTLGGKLAAQNVSLARVVARAQSTLR